MTPDQKTKDLENKLTGFSQKYLMYRKLHEEAIDGSMTKVRYLNTMAQTREKIKNVLFDMFLIDLESKLCQQENKQTMTEAKLGLTPNSQPQAVSDGGTAQEA